MSHEDQIYALKTAEFAADGDECIRRDDAARIARAADAEIANLRKAEEAYRLDLLAKIKEANLLDAEVAKLRAENERLSDLAWRYRGELNQAQEEFAKLKYERLPAIKAMLNDLDALFPPDASA